MVDLWIHLGAQSRPKSLGTLELSESILFYTAFASFRESYYVERGEAGSEHTYIVADGFASGRRARSPSSLSS